MRAGLRSLTLTLGILLGFAALPPIVASSEDLPVAVTVDGKSGYAEAGTTVAELLSTLDLKPAAGNLVSVKGHILKPGINQGRVLLNGATANLDAALADGDAIVLEHGKDVREPVEKTLAPAVGVGTNIHSIPVYYGLQVYTVRGKISHEVMQEGATGAAHPAVALTFDDGPTPDWTPRVLAVLNKYKIKATFFQVGRMVRAYPAINKALLAGGMVIQNHSWGHENFARLSPYRQWHSMLDQIRALRAQGIPAPTWFRPPYGAMTRDTVRLATSLGMRTIIWSTDAHDYTRPPSGFIARVTTGQCRPGCVMLLHDGGGNRSNTVGALSSIIETLLKRGYRFVTLV